MAGELKPARCRTQNSARQILRFTVALRREAMSPIGLGFAGEAAGPSH
jgi:hypothetical protein